MGRRLRPTLTLDFPLLNQLSIIDWRAPDAGRVSMHTFDLEQQQRSRRQAAPTRLGDARRDQTGVGHVVRQRTLPDAVRRKVIAGQHAADPQRIQRR